MTEYVVLAKGAEGNEWRIADGKVEAAGATQAIRKVAERQGEGTYVATPLRSWEEHVVKVEPTVKVTFGSGT